MCWESYSKRQNKKRGGVKSVPLVMCQLVPSLSPPCPQSSQKWGQEKFLSPICPQSFRIFGILSPVRSSVVKIRGSKTWKLPGFDYF